MNLRSTIDEVLVGDLEKVLIIGPESVHKQNVTESMFFFFSYMFLCVF